MSASLRLAAAAEDSPATGTPSLLQLVAAGTELASWTETLAAVADWWSAQTSGYKVVIQVRDPFWSGRHLAIAEQGQPTEVRWIEDCAIADPSFTKGDRPADGQPEVVGHGQPLNWNDREVGEVWLAGPARTAAETPPAESLAMTACLLFSAREREQRLLAEKLESLAEFAAGAGHEINNPLGSILGRVQLLSRDESSAERRRMLATIGAQALRVRDMIGDAMLFARPPTPQPRPVAIAEAIGDVVRQFSHAAAEQRVHLETSGSDTDLWSADPVQLRIVVSELIRNALHAAPEDSRVTLRWHRQHGNCAVMGVLEVSDNGPGLTPDVLRHLFDPFYSGRQAGRGLGFGLSKCWRIVTGHGACLHARTLEPGLRLTVHWPLAIDNPASSSE